MGLGHHHVRNAVRTKLYRRAGLLTLYSAIAALGAGVSYATPYHRPFSLLDLDISFPLVAKEMISTSTLVLVSLVAPAIIILLVVAIFVPGPIASRSAPKSLVLRRKLWEWNAGWMGLGLSLAIAFFITSGTKNIFGKPRPDMLARCNPDLSDIAAHVVGGYGKDISARWTLVSSTICQTTDISSLNDGFRSFPSGHSSFSFSGLLYLSLFLCSKFAITIPYLSTPPFAQNPASSRLDEHELLPLHSGRGASNTSGKDELPLNSAAATSSSRIPIRNQAAAPPNYILVLALFPVCVAIYICATRYTDFMHHGFDIISGSLIGILSAWFAFRWYHLPLRQGQGWAWGARSRDRAFGITVGLGSYVGAEGWKSEKGSVSDIEAGGFSRRSQQSDSAGASDPA